MIILIDNGHGKNTAGKCSPMLKGSIDVGSEFVEDDAFKEWKYTRVIAKQIVDKLAAMDYDAKLLVTETTDIALSERVRRVNSYCSKYGSGNVLLISVHANALGNATKWMTGRGWEAYTTIGKTNSDKLCGFLYARARKNFEGMKVRDVKEANFYIIKNSNCPSVLTENFFYDNKEDLAYMVSDEGIHAVVRTHIEGILDYIQSKQ